LYSIFCWEDWDSCYVFTPWSKLVWSKSLLFNFAINYTG
jgi:hypothetical protein